MNDLVIYNLIIFIFKAKKDAPVNEKPDVVKTHLRDMIIVPEMIGSMVGVYNGKAFNQVEVKVSGTVSRAFKFVTVDGFIC